MPPPLPSALSSRPQRRHPKHQSSTMKADQSLFIIFSSYPSNTNRYDCSVPSHTLPSPRRISKSLLSTSSRPFTTTTQQSQGPTSKSNTLPNHIKVPNQLVPQRWIPPSPVVCPACLRSEHAVPPTCHLLPRLEFTLYPVDSRKANMYRSQAFDMFPSPCLCMFHPTISNSPVHCHAFAMSATCKGLHPCASPSQRCLPRSP
ncbi:hypothetical protein V8C44DRAFT_87080 [Trichoderma aethiopicum]